MTFDHATFALICEMMSGGLTLREICRDEKLPTKTTVLRWVAMDVADGVSDQYARARARRWPNSGRPFSTSDARLNHFVTMSALSQTMEHDGFDATITLNDHHLVTAGLSGRQAEAVAAVRQSSGWRERAGSTWTHSPTRRYWRG
jgi:hypothetical protein